MKTKNYHKNNVMHSDFDMKNTYFYKSNVIIEFHCLIKHYVIFLT